MSEGSLSKTQRKNRYRRARKKAEQAVKRHASSPSSSSTSSSVQLLPNTTQSTIRPPFDSSARFHRLLLLLTLPQDETSNPNSDAGKHVSLLKRVETKSGLWQYLESDGSDYIKEIAITIRKLKMQDKVDPSEFIDGCIEITHPTYVIHNQHCNYCNQATVCDYTCDQCGWASYCSQQCLQQDCKNTIESAIQAAKTTAHSLIRHIGGFHCLDCTRLQKLTNQHYKFVKEMEFKEFEKEPGNVTEMSRSIRCTQQCIENTYILKTSLTLKQLTELIDPNLPPPAGIKLFDEHYLVSHLYDWISCHRSPCTLYFMTGDGHSYFSVLNVISSDVSACAVCNQVKQLEPCLECTFQDVCKDCRGHRDSAVCRNKFTALEMILPRVQYKHTRFDQIKASLVRRYEHNK